MLKEIAPETGTQIKGKILIVDDEAIIRDSLGKWFSSEGYMARTAASAREALEVIHQAEFDIALIDIRMPGMDGMALQSRLREAAPELTVIIMTGYPDVDTAIRALKIGAWDYVTKPVDPDELSHLVSNAFERKRAHGEVARLREHPDDSLAGSPLIGRSTAMKEVSELVRMVAPTDATVLITGESGTGKEVVARAIHQAGPRRSMPMVTIHCGALTETLLESELFGHEKGAFTGAQYRKMGKFEVADGGTIFLDEIANISLRTQTDLLRVLQEKEIVRVGGNQTVKVDFRCVAATNKSLEQLVKEGTFRPDLYYRLHVFCIDLPPLRKRREDVPVLAQHFLNKFCQPGGRPTPQLSAEAMETLMRHHWPGNVRELENAVERALVVGRGSELRPADFSLELQEEVPSGRTLDEIERAHIERVLRETEHNLTQAARVLDIDRTTLYARLRRYGLR